MSTSPTITRLDAVELLDSRGLPTLEVHLMMGDRVTVASVPSGKSTGQHEALELRDGDPHRYRGRGVQTAVAHVRGDIAREFVGKPLPDQQTADQRLIALDGTPNKARLGVNAILGVSMAVARAQALVNNEALYRNLVDDTSPVLPVPCFNVINGGAHASNALEFQEFMIAPIGRPTFAEAVRAGAETYQALGQILEEMGLPTAVGDEGGFAPPVRTPTEALDLLLRAIERAGYRAGEDISIALDPAANGFWREGRYQVTGQSLTATELIHMYGEWLARYPILSIEDGLAEDDRDGWVELTAALGTTVQLVGDDIFVSDEDRLRTAASEGIANAILLKPNQVGTVTEILRTARAARDLDYRAMVSHRSGETIDTFIADLAVALGAGQLKAGAPARGERVAKYNRLLTIEYEHGATLDYAGAAAFPMPGRK